MMIASSAPWAACSRRNVMEHCSLALALERKHYRRTCAAMTYLFRPAQARRTTSSGRHEKARLRALKHDAGQPAGRKRPGVDVDPVRQHLGPLARRVPVNHDPTEIRRAVEKLIPYP